MWALGFAAVFLTVAIGAALVAISRGRKRTKETKALGPQETFLCEPLGNEDCVQDPRCVWLQSKCEHAETLLGTGTNSFSETVKAPIQPVEPTSAPSLAQTMTPSGSPSVVPTLAPTQSPTNAPTTKQPTSEPTQLPTSGPTATPYYPGDLKIIRRE